MTPNEFRNNRQLGLRGFFIVVLIEMKAFWNNKNILYSKVLTPIFYFLFLTVGIKQSMDNFEYQGQNVNYIQYTTIGIFGILIISQMSQAVYRTVIDKRWGLLPIKLFNGIRPKYYVIGMSTFPLISVFIQVLIVYSLSVAIQNSISFYSFIIIVFFSLICLIFWTSLGIIISLMVKNYQQRDILLSVLYLPISFTAPTFYSLDHAPIYILVLSHLNPLTYQLNAMRSVVFGNINFQMIGITLALSLLMYLFAVFLIKRAPLLSEEK
ncbi:ABC transporter permease [Sporolactobacillus terrae]|uniref:Transport permease protein n=1 Tax=Sporolactobacillus terrae TaxID=269673 RepID=A0A410DBN6_9BACL|nr:ABC transporter permease [Sporolactobacillus terrae]QAA23523.1 ABC transporter permease [Sporolactobacillus terrae]QAA26493.1 ABC transporter permease [Sporolactobacillus terrae]UAK15579.1 ABC transporter permease [Sporolactobacillus terrae]BBO00002.1 daunorubicin ABC transporter permease [Sporolactobacillus terrae]